MRSQYRFLLLSFSLALFAGAHAVTNADTGLIGRSFEYEVLPGDYLIRIAARFGESATLIARDNGIPLNRPIRPGQRLTLNNRHLVPGGLQEGLLINLPQRHLFFFRSGRLVAAYPVGLGRPDWPTPAGAFRVTELRRHPAWHVPPSIQEEMRREGEAVRTLVPPGPDNPLGEYWIGISLDGVGIHGTIAPPSVYHFQSHGCIRLHPADVEALYAQMVPGMPGQIIYEPVLLAGFPDGRIYLEVNPDVYHRRGDAWQTLLELAKAQGLTERIDWKVARVVVAGKEGIARPIERGAGNEP